MSDALRVRNPYRQGSKKHELCEKLFRGESVTGALASVVKSELKRSGLLGGVQKPTDNTKSITPEENLLDPRLESSEKELEECPPVPSTQFRPGWGWLAVNGDMKVGYFDSKESALRAAKGFHEG